MKITRQLDEAPRTALTWEALWQGPDKGIIACWERGLEKRQETPSMAVRALAGELPVLPWKGGVHKPIKGEKFGTHFYLAMWQGLRGEKLEIDTNREVTIVCSKTNVQVTFTSDQNKYANAV